METRADGILQKITVKIGGLKMNLVIQEQELRPIETNLAEIKAYAESVAAKFKGVRYDESQMKLAKADRAEIRHIKEDIETRRKQLKAAWNKPYLEVEVQIKETTAILDGAAGEIDTQVKEYEAKQVKEREEYLREFYEKWDLRTIVKFERVIDGEKWLNLSYRAEKAAAELAEKLNKIGQDIATLETILETEYRTACLAEYAQTLDVNEAIAKQVKLRAAKAEQEKVLGVAVEEPKVEAPATVSKMETVAPVDEDPFTDAPAQVQISTRRYAITATDAKFVELRQWCAANGIKLREVF
jgi:hypothetical protein